MISLLAVMLFELSPTLCNEVERELIEYNQMGGNIGESDIERIVESCRFSWDENSEEP